MGEKKRKEEARRTEFIFEKKNYLFMLIGVAFIALGFILMTGGGSDDPNVFNPEIYSWRRIRLAPALILIGFGIEVYAILLNPHKK
ncbi:DUF3098 domain-containing protein [Altibacter sp.]|uniref:DUF3098 domain-containing protein n=1 Tax=Altibacter sp. TaxID=2024823 RepID=UPI000C8FADF6|nr:DUF3098 domain-containing protein [Altibacter sp.]MAP53663.1 hypothetical protein [Altibacter sp.]|tara:strand:- start:175 stop:432 length:258 start_codon:yes stop_codon:yes gene_type:complete